MVESNVVGFGVFLNRLRADTWLVSQDLWNEKEARNYKTDNI